jgi:hypothetical protein
VFAYAAHYLDRFMALTDRVELTELQVLAFGALLLATKIEGVAFPKLGKMFDIEQILAAEIRITLKLNYFLHPKTYVHLLSDLTKAWDRFADKGKLYNGQRYLPQSLAGFQRYRALHERMECVYMGSSLLTQPRKVIDSQSTVSQSTSSSSRTKSMSKPSLLESSLPRLYSPLYLFLYTDSR